MRVDYISPALQPGISTELPESPGIAPSFREQYHGSIIPLPLRWEQQLRLDARPFTASYIGPPPRPQSPVPDDVQTQRLRWRNIVSRHSGALNASQDSDVSPCQQSVQTMLEMLAQMQQMEDSILSRQAALTRG